MNEIKYKYGRTSDFYSALRSEVNDYFESNNISKHANIEMIVKIIVTLVLYLGSYFGLLFLELPMYGMVFLTIVMGVSMAGVFLNISHDASHYSLFKDKSKNKILWYSMELIGLSSYIWNYLHNYVHHVYTSIEGQDIILEEYSILRLSKNQSYMSIHKYQCIYAIFVYSLFSVFLIFVTDFTLFSRNRMGRVRDLKHATKEYVKLYLTKLFFLFYTLVIPLLVIDLAWWKILIGYYIMHASAGFVLAIVGVLNHQIDESVFPEPDEAGYIHNSQKNHELEVTIDFSPQSRFQSWLFGGFNTHVAHHLFPHICHIHYIPITKIIKSKAQEYGVNYKEQTLWNSIKSHFRYLKRLSKENE